MLKRCQPLFPIPPSQQWNQVFNGETYFIEKGVDYECPTDTYIEIVKHKAKIVQVQVKIEIIEGGFVVQAVK